ncbi:MAG: hypothetical protein KGR98_10570 [Verrucomicrobia bacterium]|nr:hypothetical protein [Verrucomicrobiota bacterium]MDE3099203.1 hypothetical protein [Verrucomicrobiota bacterium]
MEDDNCKINYLPLENAMSKAGLEPEHGIFKPLKVDPMVEDGILQAPKGGENESPFGA